MESQAPILENEENYSARKRSKTNADGLLLTKSGHVSVGRKQINAKHDASYRNRRNAENTNRLLGRALTLGQACGLIGVELFRADIPLEGAGDHRTYYVYFAYSAYLEILC
jgi:hypothetical protein